MPHQASTLIIQHHDTMSQELFLNIGLCPNTHEGNRFPFDTLLGSVNKELFSKYESEGKQAVVSNAKRCANQSVVTLLSVAHNYSLRVFLLIHGLLSFDFYSPYPGRKENKNQTMQPDFVWGGQLRSLKSSRRGTP